MSKQGMKRPDRTHTKQKNDQTVVPEIQGKAKSSKIKARPIIAGTNAPAQKVYHSKPVPISKNIKEKPISDVYSVIDTDLARDNLENDIPSADLEDL